MDDKEKTYYELAYYIEELFDFDGLDEFIMEEANRLKYSSPVRSLKDMSPKEVEMLEITYKAKIKG